MNEATAAALERFAERTKAEQEAEERAEREIGERLKLPALLEQRRRQHKIPEAAFQQVALYDHVLVWQCDSFSDTYGESGLIHKPQNVRANEREEAPRGVVITAGLRARDSMWGHGIEIGHYVNFGAYSPRRLYLDDTYKVELVVLRDGDLLASEDVQELERQGVLQVRQVVVEGKRQHVYFDTRTNEIRVPWEPHAPGED